MKKRNLFPFLFYMAILGALLWVLISIFSGSGNAIAYSEVIKLLQNEQVKSFVVEDGQIKMELHEAYKDKTSIKTGIADPELFRQEVWELIQSQHAAGILERYDFVEERKPTFFDMILPLLIVGLVLLILWFLLMSRANNQNAMANFGKARTVLGVPDGKKVTFDDVAGADEEKQELQEVVDFLRDPAKYTRIGARIPHGILLVGPPGTGKTLLARAVAGEADVQFLSICMWAWVPAVSAICSTRQRNWLPPLFSSMRSTP